MKSGADYHEMYVHIYSFFYCAHHHYDWRKSDLDPAVDFQKKFQHIALRPHDVKKFLNGGAQENLSVKKQCFYLFAKHLACVK